ncbi:MAG TPA: hypothetical protein VGR30_10080 [Candidatus Binatia bacterium]|jgi:hypothetical protein|nr:hypothetical protein [Candidatus Binatia bacterium]
MKRVFLLSPASCSGERARLLLNQSAQFDLAKRIRSAAGAPLGEVFSFLSGLYFRGKLAYAQAFARPPPGRAGVLIITPSEGLLAHDMLILLTTLRKFALVPIDKDNQLYRRSLLRAVRKLAAEIGPGCEVILLGSIASGKYLDILTPALGDRLRVPAEFIGRGDMSRGGLMLRCVKEQRELDYIHVNGFTFHGHKPPKLIPNL